MDHYRQTQPLLTKFFANQNHKTYFKYNQILNNLTKTLSKKLLKRKPRKKNYMLKSKTRVLISTKSLKLIKLNKCIMKSIKFQNLLCKLKI